MIKFTPLLTAVAIGLTVISCNSTEDQDTLNKSSLIDSNLSKLAVSDETINGIINSIPSPLETTTLIKESGLKYDESYLNPCENLNTYKSKYEKSFAIGIYSADLGYLNLYEKNFAAINYIVTVHKLAEDLNLEQFFDFETLKRLASSNKNLDSLLYISTSCFNKMDIYLRKNKRSEQSSLIIIGAWTEGLYFETRMAKNNPSKKIKESIGAQKVAMNNIMAILDAYKGNTYFENIRNHISPLKLLFDKVEISYNYVEPESKEVNGELVIIEKSESEVSISEEIFTSIINTTETTRNAILNFSSQ
jgi:hypothetical protein